MTLKEQLLSELRYKNEIAQKEIKALEKDYSSESREQIKIIEKKNEWVSEMLAKYK